MPLTRLAVDALGVVTICLVILLVLIGAFCIIYTLYFCYRIQRSGFIQLSYFNGPWIVRSSFALFGIWWAINEIVRLGLLRQEGHIFDSLGKEWQEDVCKYYILANLGFAEPCLFIIMSFLLRASLKWRGSGILSPRWNVRTAGYVLLYCLPVFLLDLIFVFVGPKIGSGNSKFLKLPPSFTRTIRTVKDGQHPISVCCFPLLCTILHGIFTFILIAYLLFLGRRMVSSVINKSLQRRIYTLIFLVSCFLPSRVILLGFSVLARAHFLLLEALAFAGFVLLLSCVIVAIFMLVYLPVADSLALRSSLLDAEAGSRNSYTTSATSAAEPYRYEPIPLVAAASQSLETSTSTSLGRDSDASTKPGSISFRTMINHDPSAAGAFEEELRVFSPGFN